MTQSPPPLNPNRDPGDAWVEAPTGEKFWGLFGAAGLLAVDPERGILMQHRALWSHYGGTWGLPGGALHRGESAIAGALREAGEEAGVPVDSVRPVATTVLDRGVWTYTTVIANVTQPFVPVAGDAESLELAWVAIDEVARLGLHPSFAAAWPGLMRMLTIRPMIVVDAANVVGSVPDGWWRDRRGAATRLLVRLEQLCLVGIAADSVALMGTRWFPELHVILEGQARGANAGDLVIVTEAQGSGDDAILAVAGDGVANGRNVVVVTSDRELSDRVRMAGGVVRGAGWLLNLLASQGNGTNADWRNSHHG